MIMKPVGFMRGAAAASGGDALISTQYAAGAGSTVIPAVAQSGDLLVAGVQSRNADGFSVSGGGLTWALGASQAGSRGGAIYTASATGNVDVTITATNATDSHFFVLVYRGASVGTGSAVATGWGELTFAVTPPANSDVVYSSMLGFAAQNMLNGAGTGELQPIGSTAEDPYVYIGVYKGVSGAAAVFGSDSTGSGAAEYLIIVK